MSIWLLVQLTNSNAEGQLSTGVLAYKFIILVEMQALASCKLSIRPHLAEHHLIRGFNFEPKVPRDLVQMAKKWQRMAALARKRFAPPSMYEETEGSCCTSVSKGHCIVYSADGRWFEVPLAYLGTVIFGELLRMSQEEFGFTSDDGGRITLPCDAGVEYAVCLLRRGVSEEVERAFLSSMARPCSYGNGLTQFMGSGQTSFCN